ncbi:hypothetical protein M885DRAFT_540357 [Pelagophyceae sp. CCMP2097]|nr:hypothetical protein M885DRAFT_540357 [Pelagophyceae sp. CCMP2097]
MRMLALALILASCAALEAPAKRPVVVKKQWGLLTPLLTAFPAHALAATAADNEFTLADINRNGKLTRDEFRAWFDQNDVLTAPPPADEGFFQSLTLPEVALDLTGLLGIVVAVYAASYAFFLSQQVDELELMSAKAKVKAKPGAKPKPAAAAADDADDE